MSQLYCGACQNYLMGSDGECHDCSCGWKQPIESRNESGEIEALRQRVAELEAKLTQETSGYIEALNQCTINADRTVRLQSELFYVTRDFNELKRSL